MRRATPARSIARGEEQHCVERLVWQLREQDEQEAREQWKRIHLDADCGRSWKFPGNNRGAEAVRRELEWSCDETRSRRDPGGAGAGVAFLRALEAAGSGSQPG